MADVPPALEPISLPTERADLFGPPFEFSRLRDQQPLRRLLSSNGDLGWLVTSHRLARKVLTDSRFGKDDPAMLRLSEFSDPARAAEFRKACHAVGYRPMRGFIEMNPPEHTRYRRLLAPHFTTRRIAAFRPRVEQIVSERLDELARAGSPFDLVSAFAVPVSLSSQCALLGLPVSQTERFFRLGTSMFDPTVPARAVVELWREAYEYVRTLAEQKRADPVDDVISDIASHAELTIDEIADTALVLFQGGLETTGDMIALGAFVLLCHPEQLEDLLGNPAASCEELLRYAGIFRLTRRTALEDAELDGTTIKAGEPVTVSLAAANRDPDKFECPDALDLTRSPTGHVSFAQGIHMCIGQDLARVELQVALTGLIERFPTLRLAVPADVVPLYGPDSPNFGVYELPVDW